MPFRTDPLTSASALDTRDDLADPGVVIAGTRAEWVHGAQFGVIELQTAGGVSGGSTFAIRQGAGAGVQFSEEELPGGGYENTARLTGLERGIEPLVGPLPLVFPDTAKFAPYDPTGNVWSDPRAWQTADGMVHLRGMVSVVTAGQWGNDHIICRTPAGIPLPGDRQPLVFLGFNNRLVRLDLWGDGTLRWAASISPDLAFAAGQYLAVSVDYLPL